MSTRPTRRHAGFTMVEMMIVVLIIAILSAFAVPAMRSMIRIQQVKTASFDIFASLTLARSEAIKRNVPVTMTPAGGDWGLGWTVTDSNGNVLRTQDAYDTVTARGTRPRTIVIAGPANVVYNSAGRLTAGAVPAPFVLTSNAIEVAIKDQQERCVFLDLSGRPRSGVGKTGSIAGGICP